MFRSEEIIAATGARLSSGVPRSVSGVSLDSRTIRPGELFIAIRGQRFDGHDFLKEAFGRRAAGAIVKAGPAQGQVGKLKGPLWEVPDTVKALGDLARFHRQRFHLPLVAITGSSGKTTTKTMVAHILSGSKEILATPGTQNNLIGVPLTLLRLHSGHQAAVLELGTSQWGEIRRLTEIARPTVGVVTQIGPAHLQTFGNLRGVLKAKAELWEEMEPQDPLILNAEDPLLWEEGRKLNRPVVWFGSNPRAEVRASRITWEPWGSRCLINERWQLQLPLPGRHNLMNALAALACVKVLGEDIPEVVERLRSVPPLPGRLSQGELDGAWVIDDSYNANPASLKVALEVLQGLDRPGRRIAVLGDMLELGEQAETLHREAGVWIAHSPVDLLLTVGALSRHLLAAALEAGFPKESGRAFDTAQEAREFLMTEIRPGDTVLLKGSRRMQMERVLTCCTTSFTH